MERNYGFYQCGMYFFILYMVAAEIGGKMYDLLGATS